MALCRAWVCQNVLRVMYGYSKNIKIKMNLKTFSELCVEINKWIKVKMFLDIKMNPKI